MKHIAEAIWQDRQTGMSWEDAGWKSFFRGERIFSKQELPATDSEITNFVKLHISIPKTKFFNKLAPTGWGYLDESHKRDIMKHTDTQGVFPERLRKVEGAVRPRKYGHKPKPL